MAFPIGEGEVRVKINDRDLMTGLSKDEAEVRQKFAAMGRLRATPELDAKMDKLDRKLDDAKGKLLAFRRLRAEATIDGDKSKLDRAIERSIAEIRMLDAMKAEVKIDVDKARMAQATTAMGRLRQGIRDFRQEAEHAGVPGAKLISNLGNVTTRIGPFTASLKNVVAGLAVFAPMVVQTAGALGSLISVLGSATLGAGALASAVGVGAVGAFGGAFLAVKPFVSQLGAAFKASKAVADQTLKYGKNSAQAKNAQDKLNQTLKGVSPAARSAFKDLGGMMTQWKKLTAPAKAPFFEAIGQGIKTAKALMPTFARDSVTAVKGISGAFTNFATQLRSGGFGQALHTVMSNFSASLPSVGQGLGNLVEAFTRLAASASRFLQPAAKAFETWSSKVLGAASDTNSLNNKVDQAVSSLKSVWNFAKAAGNALKALFAPGVGAGKGFLDDMTKGLQNFTKWAKSAGGQKSLQDFFKNSVKYAEDLWSAVKPIGKSFLEWADAMRPFSDGLLKAVTALGHVVTWLEKIPGFKGLIQALAFAFVASKVVAFASALKDVYLALKEIKALGTLSSIIGGVTKNAAGGAGGGILGNILGGAAGGGIVGKLKSIFKRGGVQAGEQLSLGLEEATAGGAGGGLLARVFSAGALRAAGAVGAGLFIGHEFMKGLASVTGNSSLAEEAGKSIWHQMSLGFLDTDKTSSKDVVSKMTLADKIRIGIVPKFKDQGHLLAQAFQSGLMGDLSSSIASLGQWSTRLQSMLLGLTHTHGGRILIKVALQGGQEAQRELASLAKTQLGRKILRIAESGSETVRRALRQLITTPVGQKVLQVIQRGGPEALTAIRRLQNAKVAAKVMRILEKGGSNVQGRIEKILGMKLAAKTQRILESGYGPTFQKLQTLNHTPLRDKLTHLMAHDGASGIIHGVLGLLSQIPAVKTIQIIAHGALNALHGGHAMGGPSSLQTPFEMAASAERTRGGRYSTPKFLVGDSKSGPEMVISPDPTVRKQNINYWRMAARMLGIPGFAGGGPHATGGHAQTQANPTGAMSGGAAQKLLDRLTGPRSRIETMKARIDDKGKRFDQAQRAVDQGFDESQLLNEDGSINQTAISKRVAQIQTLIGLKVEIQDLYSQLVTIVEETIRNVREVRDQMRGAFASMPNTLIHHSWKGTGKKRHLVRTTTHNDAKDKLGEAIQAYNDAIPGLVGEKNDAKIGYDDIGLDIGDLKLQQTAVSKTAPTTSEGDRKQTALEGALALAGVTPGGDVGGAQSNLAAFFRSQIASGQAMLSDSDPTNDTTAWQQITAAAGGLAGIPTTYGGTGDPGSAGGAGGSAGTSGIISQMNSFDQSRQDLYNSFAGNGTPYGGGAVGRQVNITNNYQTQPTDPHTWSKQLGWELGALL